MNDQPTSPTLDSLGTDTSNVPAPGRKWLVRFGLPVAIILSTVAALVFTGWQALRPTTPVQASIVAVRAVETDSPRNRPDAAVVQAPGWVEPDPFSNYVAALTQGVVKEILVLEGDEVHAGQIVAKLIDDDARINLRRIAALVTQRQGERDAAIAVLNATTIELEELVELKRSVIIAQAMVAKLTANLEGYPAKITEEEAKKDQLVDEFQRKTRLVDDGAVAAGPVARLALQVKASESRIDTLKTEHRAAKASRDAAVAELHAAQRRRTLLTHETLEVERSKAEYQIAEGNLEQAIAMKADAELALERTNVRTPVSGIVIERLTSPGSTVQFQNGAHGAHIIHVYNPKELQVRADIPLSEAAKVGVGQPAEIVVDLLPDKVFKGKVSRFLHKADVSKNTVEAKVRIIDPSPLLKPEMLARVRILPAIESEETTSIRTVDRVFIPVTALREGDYAWVIKARSGDRGVATRRALELGTIEVEGWREVLSGLLPGDAVVIGDSALQEGESLRMVTTPVDSNGASS